MAKRKVTADQIKRALSERHVGDFFICEVKNGSTMFADDLLIIDAMAMAKSWKHPCFTGYEIKVSRSDFLRDEKWHKYLNYCHMFSFVCPPDVIKKEEIPDQVGLVVYDQKYQTGLHTVKKPVWRNIEISVEMLYYILMSKVENDRHPFFSSRREKYEKYAEDKMTRKELGYTVSKKFRDEFHELEQTIRDQNREIRGLKARIDKVNQVEQTLQKHGIEIGQWRWEERLKEKLTYGGDLEVKKCTDEIFEMCTRLKKLIDAS